MNEVQLRNAIASITAATLVAASVNLFAASDGVRAATSSSAPAVIPGRPDLVQVSGVSDVSLPDYAPGSDLTGNTNLCVYSNTAGTYYVTLTSTSGGFNLTDGTNTIPYSVNWEDSEVGATAITYNMKSSRQSGDSSSTTCGGTTNANLAVTVDASDFALKPAGSYSDTITILVSPT